MINRGWKALFQVLAFSFLSKKNAGGEIKILQLLVLSRVSIEILASLILSYGNTSHFIFLFFCDYVASSWWHSIEMQIVLMIVSRSYLVLLCLVGCSPTVGGSR